MEFAILPPEAIMYCVASGMKGTQGVTALKTVVNDWLRGYERISWNAFMHQCMCKLFADGLDPARTALEEQKQDGMPAERFSARVRANYVALLSRQVGNQLEHLDPDTEFQILTAVLTNMNKRTHDAVVKDGMTGRMALEVRGGRMTFLQFWDALKPVFESIPFVQLVADRRRRLYGTGREALRGGTERRGVHWTTEEDHQGEEHAECEGECQHDDAGDEEDDAVFLALGDMAEPETWNAKSLPPAMTGIHVIKDGESQFLAPEVAVGGYGAAAAADKKCWSCGKTGHLSTQCPNYDKSLPGAPPDARRRLQRHAATGQLRATEGRVFGNQGVSEKGRAASGRMATRGGNLFVRGGSQSTK